MINWYCGWSMILAAFVSGAWIGLRFYQDDFLGGYLSFRRRILRLGHVALAALGMMNVLYSVAGPIQVSAKMPEISSIALIVGGVTMPMVCFLSAWRPSFRHLFFIPVAALITAVVHLLRIGPP